MSGPARATAEIPVIEHSPQPLGPSGAGVLVGMPGPEAKATFSAYDLADHGRAILGRADGSSGAPVGALRHGTGPRTTLVADGPDDATVSAPRHSTAQGADDDTEEAPR